MVSRFIVFSNINTSEPKTLKKPNTLLATSVRQEASLTNQFACAQQRLCPPDPCRVVDINTEDDLALAEPIHWVFSI